MQRAFLYNCTNMMLNFLLRGCLEDVNTGTNSISSLSPNLGARDAFVALAVVVAKAPYILKRDSSILVLLQARLKKRKARAPQAPHLDPPLVFVLSVIKARVGGCERDTVVS